MMTTEEMTMAKVKKVLALREALRQELSSPEYKEAKKMERGVYLQNLNVWRRQAHAVRRAMEIDGSWNEIVKKYNVK